MVFGAFFPSVLLLRATVEASPRLERLQRGIGVGTADAVQNLTLYGSHVLGAVLNVGAMSILAPVVARNVGDRERTPLASGAARGVGAAVVWSPFFVAMGFSSRLVPGVKIGQVMAIGAGLAVIGLALSHCIFTRSLDARAFAKSLARLRPLVMPMAVMIAAVIVASAVLGWGGLETVSLVAPVCCAAYLAALGPSSARGVGNRALASFGRLTDEMLIVVGATMLAAVVSALPAAHAIGSDLTPGLISGVTLIAVLVVVLVVLGFAGLHPMIGVGILLPVLATGAFGICQAVLVETAVFAWGLSASISMWTLPVVAASLNFGVPVRELMSRRSLTYGVVWGILGIVYLGAVNAACHL